MIYNLRMRQFLILILFLLSFQSFAKSFGRIRYQIRGEKNLYQIFAKFLKPKSRITKNGPLIKINIQRNAQIKDWGNLPNGEFIDLYLPREMISKKKFLAYQKEKKERLKILKSKIPSPWSHSLFYMASYGLFSQAQGETKINFQQNSPLSLGMTSFYKWSEETSLTASIYFSYLISATSELSSENVSIRPEVGGNLYWSRKLGTGWSFFTGLDAERFTAFNIDEMRTTGTIILDENRVSYLTIGIDKFISLSKKGLLLKASVSPVLNSQRLDYQTGEAYRNTYKGYKFLLYANTSINESYFFHVLYKHHVMSGPGDIEVQRIGVGFGYRL